MKRPITLTELIEELKKSGDRSGVLASEDASAAIYLNEEAREEEDKVEILSGLFEGRTTGTPISMLVRNTDARPGAYDEMGKKFRPSHADFTYQAKFGIRDHQGGGRASARPLRTPPG